jgi:hypothetical protein
MNEMVLAGFPVLISAGPFTVLFSGSGGSFAEVRGVYVYRRP